MEHQFGDKEARKQIGNAVPPVFAKILLEHIKRFLMKTDGIPDRPDNESPEVIEL